MNLSVLYSLPVLISSIIALGIGVALGILWADRKNQSLRIKLAELRKEHELEGEKIQWLEQAKEQLRETFTALAANALQTNADNFLQRSNERIAPLVDPLQESLAKLGEHVQELEQKREHAYGDLQRQLTDLATQENRLQTTTDRLSEALYSTKVRGRWGELELGRILELAGMQEHIDFEQQLTISGNDSNKRPDVIINLPGHGIVVVDAKAPMNAYLEAMTTSDDEKRTKGLETHVKAVRKHVNDLATKSYWKEFDGTPELTVMFIPSEACLRLACERDPELLDFALGKHILITTPVSLLAILKSIAYGWQQVKITESVRHINEEGKKLYNRMFKFAKYLADLGESLRKSIDIYNSAITIFQSHVLPFTKKFEALTMQEWQAMETIDTVPVLPAIES